jgi:hypothetical protein
MYSIPVNEIASVNSVVAGFYGGIQAAVQAAVSQVMPEAHTPAQQKVIDAYSDGSANSNSSVKEQLAKAKSQLDKLSPVAVINDDYSYAKFDRAGIIRRIVNALKPSGFKANVKEYGEVLFGEEQIKDSIKYKPNQAAVASYIAIPDVLQEGIVINRETNYKNRLHGSFTIAAPITLNGKRGNMAVVVSQTSTNKYKVHRVVDMNGKTFIFEIEKDGGFDATGAKPNGVATPSVSSNEKISSKSETVNPDESVRRCQTRG